MEKNKSNNKLVVILIIIIVCLVLGGGYTIYTLLSNNTNTGTNNNENSNLSDGNNDSVTDTTDKKENENTNFIETLSGNITVESITVNPETIERYFLYTKKDKDGKTLWTYKTKTEMVGQYNKIKTSMVTDDRLYIDELGTITVLNKNTGKTLWTLKYNYSGRFLADVDYVDLQSNTYIMFGSNLIVVDKNGKITKNKEYSKLYDVDFNMEGNCNFIYINSTEAMLTNGEDFIVINLKDYKEISNGTYSVLWSDDERVATYHLSFPETKMAFVFIGYNDGKMIWNYKTQTDEVAQLQTLGILNETKDKIYINDKGIIAVINKETGKTLWKNEEHKNTKGLYTSTFFDNSENMYLYSNAEPNSLIIIDKIGKTKKVISSELMKDYCLEGIYHEFTSDNYLGIGNACGNNPKPNLYINLNDYSVKTTK